MSILCFSSVALSFYLKIIETELAFFTKSYDHVMFNCKTVSLLHYKDTTQELQTKQRTKWVSFTTNFLVSLK